ncbi:MAG: O-antigen ligase family protein [Clostridia bacterium]|nr:O-antigen ligase family protein [Clostridia bacterium]
MKEKLKGKINIENILCLFIIICPFLDILSFGFRNIFNTNLSPSTFLRPVITIAVIIYLFFKKDKKFKLYTFLGFLVFAIYGVIHLYLFEKVKTGSSYSNIIHEAQYIVNYSFMILNLFLYIYVFQSKNTDKLKKSILYSACIYIVSIYLAIITHTSSYTYWEEQMGYKGWLESGNSTGAIFLLTMFIYINLIKDKKYRKIVILLLVLVGIFLIFLIGTRVGLLGFILVLAIYIIVEVFYSLLHNEKINKKYVAIGGISIIIIGITVILFGSTTLQRRKHLKDIESDIIDESLNGNAHITGDLLDIKNKIDKNELEEGYMGEAEKQSILDLYNIANKMNITNNDYRMQQLIYNFVLVKNQKNLSLILFGNGYNANFYELVFEMEIPAFLCNFGILGFCLYFVPFLSIFVYGMWIGIKNIKKIDDEYIMLELGSGFTFALSFFSGYTFFNSSTMIIIVVINALLINKIYNLKKEN